MPAISQRELIKKAYPGWAPKLDKMSENQIAAIFLRLKREGKV